MSAVAENAGLFRFTLAYHRRYYFPKLGYIFLLTFMPRVIVQWLCGCLLSTTTARCNWANMHIVSSRATFVKM